MIRSSSRRWYGGAAALFVLAADCAPARQEGVPVEPAGIAVTAGPCIDVIPDRDADGLSDECEAALTNAFAPLLMMHSTRCTLPSAGADDRIPGGYFHAAQPARGVVRLVYMPAYYRDCGWKGAKCIIVKCAGHAGDSELIVVDVRQKQNGAWLTEAVFLSAHCFGRTERDCRWYRDHELTQFEWVNGIDRGAPLVWVSDARNANYPSYDACQRGHLRIDSCDRASIPYRFPVVQERNIGSRAVPFVEGGQPPGCASGRFVEPDDPFVVAPASLECFWDAAAPFRGWQGAGSGRGATAYGDYLQHLGL